MQWTFDDFLRDQKAAREATEPAPAPAEEEKKEEKEEIWAPFVGVFDDVLPEEEKAPLKKAEESVKNAEDVLSEKTKVFASARIREASKEQEEAQAKAPEKAESAAEAPTIQLKATEEIIRKEESKAAEAATTVISSVKAAAAEAEKPLSDSKALEGETKAVKKVSTATGKIGAIGMSEEAFVEYAKNYLTSIDCVLDDVGELALQNAAESRLANGTLLTKEEAENMIEDAADLAEKKGGLFVRRYDKDGCLILRSKYIK